MKTLIKGIIVPFVPSGETEFDGYVAVDGNKIISVTKEKPDGIFDKIIDAGEMAIMPGLVNTHTHASMTLLRGVGDDLPLMKWLEEKIWTREEKMTPEMIYWGAKLAIAELLLGGVTTFSDMYVMMDEVAKAVSETGIRATLSKGIAGIYGGVESLDKGVEFANNWNGKANGRIQTMLGPHAIYTCPPDFMKKVIAESQKHNIPIHMHVSETEKEIKDCISENGGTPVQMLNNLGAFESHFLSAHCVHLTDKDMDIFREKSVFVSLNTSSNFKLASGRARIADMEGKGLRLSFGTDGAASNNDLDMWEELRWSSFTAKSFGNPSILPAKRTLEIATKGGVEALGFENLGTLETGKIADIIFIDLSAPHLKPRYSAVSHLVNCVHPSDVKHVMVNGEFVVWNRKIQTFDLEETISKVDEFARELA
jgi:5-methylthioadenosine/S-adenosylhomocysteine deaminase